MKSKSGPAPQGETTTQGRVPKLRFPEFRDAPEWEEKRLGTKATKIGSGITPNGGEKNYKSNGRPFIRSQNIGWGCLILEDVAYIDDATHSTFSATEIKEGDVFLNITGASIGRSAVSDSRVLNGNVNQHVCIIRTRKSELNPHFLNQYLLSQYGQKQIDSFQAGGNRQGLNFAMVRSFSLPLPALEEQQKIADCLSSLDDLISAHTQKLNTLKTHKKGLMQQLFPAEGETVPKLRFPEFRDKGEWGICQQGEVLLDQPDYGLNAPAVPYSEHLPTFLRITDISDDGHFLRSNRVSVDSEVNAGNYMNDGEIVLARTGASVGKSYKYKEEDGKLVFAGYLIRIRPDKAKICPDFLFHFFATDRYWRWVNSISTRSGQPGINGNEYNLLPVPLPSSLDGNQNLNEQQKIADCLSSLDELIAVQAQKLDTLKVHKKGLMQQLFPSAVEVNG